MYQGILHPELFMDAWADIFKDLEGTTLGKQDHMVACHVTNQR